MGNPHAKGRAVYSGGLPLASGVLRGCHCDRPAIAADCGHLRIHSCPFIIIIIIVIIVIIVIILILITITGNIIVTITIN